MITPAEIRRQQARSEEVARARRLHGLILLDAESYRLHEACLVPRVAEFDRAGEDLIALWSFGHPEASGDVHKALRKPELVKQDRRDATQYESSDPDVRLVHRLGAAREWFRMRAPGERGPCILFYRGTFRRAVERLSMEPACYETDIGMRGFGRAIVRWLADKDLHALVRSNLAETQFAARFAPMLGQLRHAISTEIALLARGQYISRPELPGLRWLPDYSSVKRHDVEYQFDKDQARVIGYMIAHSPSFGFDFRGSDLLGLSKVGNRRLRDLFGNTKALGALIVSGSKRGRYRLN